MYMVLLQEFLYSYEIINSVISTSLKQGHSLKLKPKGVGVRTKSPKRGTPVS